MAGAQGDSSDSILSLKEILSVGVTMKAHWQQDNQDLLEQRSVANPSITIGRTTSLKYHLNAKHALVERLNFLFLPVTECLTGGFIEEDEFSITDPRPRSQEKA
ncbi:hypothetical protein EYF80_048216 [Liparis tanakae]|uniref:Uncharacterized protein n=1 Tax=Liparis tanakae TaxID=230148 RepID=A0A4Z2FLJ3_9TELE|nr:hypothetical protein EYF80_048216 [Liparis tanakae]